MHHVVRVEKKIFYQNMSHHYNISKECVFIHVDPENITMRGPNSIMQIKTQIKSPYTRSGHTMVLFLGDT